MKRGLWIGLLLCVVLGCQRAASSLDQAEERLMSPTRWGLTEIRMDDVPVFKDGKHIPHISGVRFDSYMDWVRFLPGGVFQGHFVGATDTLQFQWKVQPELQVISLSDSVTKTAGWHIVPLSVFKDAFSMESRSTVYDPPRVTKVTLVFKAD